MGKIKSLGALVTLSVIGIAYYFHGSEHRDIYEFSDKIVGQVYDLMYTASTNNNNEMESIEKKKEEPVPYSKKYSIYDPVGVYNAKQAMQKRYEALKDFCDGYADVMRSERSVVDHIPTKEGFHYFEVSEIPFCTIPRVASKTFRNLHDRLRGHDERYQSRHLAFHQTWPKSMRDRQSAVMVRHPMERLISAYRECFAEHFDAKGQVNTPQKMSWLDFIEVAIYGAKIWAAYAAEHKGSKDSLAIDMGLINGNGLSMHWNSYWKQCGLCHPDFRPDFILSMDHFKEDLKVLLENMDNPENGLRFLKSEHNMTAGHSSMPELIEHYYSQLSKETINDIYKKYKVDFELFGYTPDYFLQFGRENN